MSRRASSSLIGNISGVQAPKACTVVLGLFLTGPGLLWPFYALSGCLSSLSFSPQTPLTPPTLPKVGTKCQSLYKMHEGVCWILGLCVALCVSLSPLPSIFIASSVCVPLLQQQQKQQIPPFANPPCCEHRTAPRGEHPGAGPSFKAEPPSPDPRGCRAPFKRITQRGTADGKTNSAVQLSEAHDPPAVTTSCAPVGPMFSPAAPLLPYHAGRPTTSRKKRKKPSRS